MEYGLIKDTTLQSMAEGLREKGFVDATRIEGIPRESFHYATENVTSDTDATPTYNANSDLPDVGTLGYSPIITEMPGASSIEFVVDIGLVHPDSNVTQCGRFEIYDRDGTKILSETINKNYKGKHTYIVPGDYVRYGRNSSYVTVADCYTAFIVDLYPLDADGNRTTYLNPEEVVNTINPEAMAEAINNAPTLPPEEAFLLTGSLIYKFSNRHWDWFINQYKDRITTKDIDNLMNAFNAGNVGDDANIPDIPFVLNVKDITNMSGAFDNQSKLRNIPVIRGTIKWSTSTDLRGFSSLYNVRDFENLFTDEMLQGFSTVKVTSTYSTPRPVNFNSARSLRSIPSWFYLFRLNEESTTWPANTYQIYYMLFSQCYVLDEALNIPVWKCKAALTSNMFSSTVSSCYRLKDFTFETINGQPVVANWKSQTINMSGELGYCVGGAYYTGEILNYNSGITADKVVYNDETYQALKDDPDYFATKLEYSRYNHDSAVRTINSLPDTSAYLATAGGTNTIMFNGAAGSKTDGGAINTLTAEEIAVAAAKGWTVSIK